MASVVERRDGEIERLQLIIKQLQRARFGRRSERIDADQLAFGLEDVETDKACAEAVQEPAAKPRTGSQGASRFPIICHVKRSGSTSARRPAHAAAARCIRSERASARCWIRYRRSSVYPYLPPQIWLPHLRYGVPSAGTGAPDRRWVGDAGAARAGPRQQILRPHAAVSAVANLCALGVDLDRSTLAGWVGGACWWLDALHEKLCANVFASDHLFADDTPVPVLDPGRGRTKTGRLWVYARDQRPWGGPAAPAAIFVFAPDRKSGVRRRIWNSSRGSSTSTATPDSSDCSSRQRRPGRLLGAYRRYFYEFFEANGSPVAAEALRRIGELYAIEARIRGQSPALRMAERRTFSKPLVEKLKVWLEQQLSRAPRRASSPMRSAMRCRAGTASRDSCTMVASSSTPIRLSARSVPWRRIGSFLAQLGQVSVKHWKRVFVRRPTRAPLSGDRGFHPVVSTFSSTDLVWRASHHLLGRQRAGLDQASDPRGD